MSRGRNGEEEQARIMEKETMKTRGQGKTGSGPKNFEKPGYGNNGMQQNPKTPKSEY